MKILWGLLGIAVIFAIALLLSHNRKAINIRTILTGFGIQLLFALLILKTTWGRAALEWLSMLVQKVIGFADEGIGFLFGDLVQGEGTIFAFQVLTIIIFFASLISVLYYVGIMQWVIKIIGGGLAKLLGTSQAESLSAAANIFVGQTEAPLVVRPFISKMTQSELFAVMTGGLASVSGSILIGYSLLGVPLEYLLAASFMAAPAGLVMAKTIMPETDKEAIKQKADVAFETDNKPVNVIDAAARGASDGLKMALEIAGMLLAFVSLVALINGGLGFIGNVFHYDGLTLEKILGVILSPLAFAIGVPWEEAMLAGQFIGQKIVINEFVAYISFAPEIGNLSDKTVAIVSFALCGFANLGSIAIQIGSLGSLAPSRRNDVARFGIRAVAAGALASLLSATIAGMLI